VVDRLRRSSTPCGRSARSHTQGILGWSQIKEYKEGLAQVEAKRAQFEEQIAAMTPSRSWPTRASPSTPVASAKVLFGDYCSACHGSGGQGNPGLPGAGGRRLALRRHHRQDLESITNGRKGAMTAHGAILSEAEVDTLANWVVQMAETQGPGRQRGGLEALSRPRAAAPVTARRATASWPSCPTGDVVTVGAANLTDGIWRFEPGGYESAKHTILHGVNQPGVAETRDAVMPAFGRHGAREGRRGKLGEQEIKKLVVYVHQLGGGQ
jgi:cytochrome c oxidase cbb3-type subunit III